MSQRSAHMFNMFIMKKNIFDEYSNWLFDILFKLEGRIDISGFSVQEARVFGYISELLLDVWVKTNNIKYIENNWIQIGNRRLAAKVFNFLKRKFIVNANDKRTHF